MRIGIDIRSLQNDSGFRGIGTYTRCLISALTAGTENEYVLFVFKNRPIPELFGGKNRRNCAVKEVTSSRKRFVWISGQLNFPRSCRKENLDLFYSPEYIVPIFAGCKKVITIHDFINSDFPLYSKRCGILRKAYFYLKDWTLNYADGIIAISEYTKKKILQLTGARQEKIRVIYEAADPGFYQIMDRASLFGVKEKYGIKNDFILYVGAIDHHKNIEGLIRAFALSARINASLVLTGVKNDPVYFERMIKLSVDLGLKSRVHFLGYIPQPDLRVLYNLARAAVSLSVYEGFGLPILEAMACGCPVIASNNTSFPEITGDAGLLVDPYNDEMAAEAIRKVWEDAEFRNTLSQRGLRRAREFSWEKTARQTLLFYKDLVKK